MQLIRTLFFFLLISFVQKSHAQYFSNKGKEFWVGYGHNQLFGAGNAQSMVLYLSADVPAKVTVSINGTSWIKTYNIPAHTVVTSDLMPKTGADDCRILAEGLFNKAIHIQSDVPIVAYVHTYGQYSSGGTMLLPVESYSYTYFSVNPEQSSTDSYSWFYVVASEDNTKVRITPSRPTVGGQLQNVPFIITLSKGQIYNVMGKINGSASFDMSGSKVQSLEGIDGKCHPVGVFSGSSRTYICDAGLFTGGADYVMQQVFPLNAWGTKYITAPTSQDAGPSKLNNNKFRVYVRDANTVVRRNGQILSGLNNNFYYDFMSGAGDLITATKPVLVAQFIPSANGCGTEGLGDPEMFCLSPVDQAINDITFYNTDKESISVNYLTMVVPQGGMSSLLIDGSNNFDYTYPHPNALGYTVVVKKLPLTPMQHTAKSDSGFTAITYGLGQYETYGYNAGTLLRNLESVVQVKNNSNGLAPYTCAGTPFHAVLKTAYRPSSILWKLSAVNNLSPNADVLLNNYPAPSDSVTEFSRKYYMYELQGNYTFSAAGNYIIPVVITDLQIENCSFSDSLKIPLSVIAAPTAGISVTATACTGDSVNFKGTSPDAADIMRWNWNLGDGSIDSVQQPLKPYTATGSQAVTLQVIRKDGCSANANTSININKSPSISFTAAAIVCSGDSVLFKGASPDAAIITKWNWAFSDGTIDSVQQPLKPYTTAGSYAVTVKAITKEGCSDTANAIILVNKSPLVTFTAVSTACTGDSVLFKGASPDAAIITKWNWAFGDGSIDSVQQTLKPYTAAGSYPVIVKVVTKEGCSDTANATILVNKSPVVTFTAASTACTGDSIAFKGNSPDAALVTKWNWAFGDGSIDSVQQPLKPYTAAGSYPVTLKAVTKDGCSDTATSIILVNKNISVTISTAASACAGDSVLFKGSSPDAALITKWSWGFGDGGIDSVQHPLKPYIAAGNYPVTLKAVTKDGCTATAAAASIIINKIPLVNFTSITAACEKDSVNFTGSSPDAAIISRWQWDFGNGSIDSVQQSKKTFSAAGNYTVKLTVISKDGCIGKITHPITINTSPVAGFTLPGLICLPAGTASFTNTSTPAANPNTSLTYNWNFGDNTTSTQTNPMHTYAATGSYTVGLKVTTNNGCTDSTTKLLNTFSTRPHASFTIAAPAACQFAPINFTATSTPATDIKSTSWKFGNGNASQLNNPVVTYNAAGNYKVVMIATASSGCTDTAEQTLLVHTLPVVEAGPAQTILFGAPVQLSGSVNGTPASVAWSPAAGIVNAAALTTTALPAKSQWYYLTVTGDGNCTGYDSVFIKVLKNIDIPNAFSPNNDGINDKWVINGLDSYATSHVDIYSRGGQKVFESSGYANPWNGTFNGQPLPVGTYYYIIRLGAAYGEPRSGTVTIIR